MAASVIFTDFAFNIAQEFYRKRYQEYYYFDQDIGKLHRTNVYRKFPWPESPKRSMTFITNTFGFREDRKTLTRKTTSQRVMVFGDSHTDGVVDNPYSFPHIAETILKAWQANLEIINAGVGFFSLYQQLLLFEKYVSLSPDVVVFTLYSGNDWLDILRTSEVPFLRLDHVGGISEHPPVREYDRLSKKEKFLLFIDEHSFILYHLHQLYYKTVSKWRVRPVKLVTYDKEVLQKASQISEPALWQSLHQAYYFKVHPEDFWKATQFHRYVITEISRFANKHGIGVLFVMLPTKYQVERESDQEVFSTLENILGLDPDRKEEDRVRHTFTGLLVEASLDYLDPYEQFGELASLSLDPLYWKQDHHLSERGHKELGRLLATKLTSLLNKRENVTHVSHEPAPRAAHLPY